MRASAPGGGGSGIGGQGAGAGNAATSGIIATGSGGGGGGREDQSPGAENDGGNGSSGIVVVRYEIGQTAGKAKATGGAITYTPTGAVHTFYSSGTFTVTDPSLTAVSFLAVAGGGGGGGWYHGGGGGAWWCALWRKLECFRNIISSDSWFWWYRWICRRWCWCRGI